MTERSRLVVFSLSITCALLAVPPAVFAMGLPLPGGTGPTGTQLCTPERTFPVESAPSGIAALPEGGFAVALPAASEVRLVDPTGTIVGRLFGCARPVSVGVLPNGQILVGDGQTGEVTRFLRNGLKSGFLGRGPGEFNLPSDIAVDPGRLTVFVVDALDHQVKAYRWDGMPLFHFGGHGADPGEFDGPNSVSVEPLSGNVLVSDFRNKRVQLFSRTGTFISTVGSTGVDEGFVFRPAGVAVDGQGRVLVAGAYQGWVQAFDFSGTYLGWCAEYGPAEGQLINPRDIAVGGGGRLFVSSYGSAEVEVFQDPTGGTTVVADAVPTEHPAELGFPEGVFDAENPDPAVEFRVAVWGVSVPMVRDRRVSLNGRLVSQSLVQVPGERPGVFSAFFSRAALWADPDWREGSLRIELAGSTLAGGTFRGVASIAARVEAPAPAPPDGAASGACGASGRGRPVLWPLLVLALALVSLRLSAAGRVEGRP